MSNRSVFATAAVATLAAGASSVVSAIVRKHRSFSPEKKMARTIIARGPVHDPNGEFAPRLVVLPEELAEFMRQGGNIAKLYDELEPALRMERMASSASQPINAADLMEFATEPTARKIADPVDVAAADEADAADLVKAFEEMLKKTV